MTTSCCRPTTTSSCSSSTAPASTRWSASSRWVSPSSEGGSARSAPVHRLDVRRQATEALVLPLVLVRRQAHQLFHRTVQAGQCLLRVLCVYPCVRLAEMQAEAARNTFSKGRYHDG